MLRCGIGSEAESKSRHRIEYPDAPVGDWRYPSGDIPLLLLRAALLAATFVAAFVAAAAVQHRTGEDADGEDAEEEHRGGRMDRGLVRGPGNRELEIDLMR